MKRLILFISLSLMCINLSAQSYDMPASGYNEISIIAVTVYDDGGQNGNYSTRVDSRLTITAQTPGARLRLSGNHILGAWNYSRIYIYDGDTNSTSILYQGAGNSIIPSKISSTDKITIKFIVDSDNPLSGFEINIEECYTCPFYAYNIVNNVISPDSVMLSWQGGDENTNWIIELSKSNSNCGNVSPSTIYYSDTNFILFDSLTECEIYRAVIYTSCDTLPTTCQPKKTTACWIQTTCPQPTQLTTYTTSDSIIVSWTEPDTSIVWSYELSYLGEVIDSGNVYQPYLYFDSLIASTMYYVKIWNDCNNNGNDCNATGFNATTRCPCAKPLYDSSYVGSSTIYLSWLESDTTTLWTVKLYDSYKLIDSFTTQNPYVFFNNLSSASNYYIYVYEDCLKLPNGRFCNDLFLNLKTQCHCPIAENVVITDVTENSISLGWDFDMFASGWIIEYKLQNSPTRFYDTTYTNYHTIDNLSITGYYEIIIHSLCDSLKLDCASKLMVINVPSNGNCLDFLNINTSNNTLTYGTFDNPYQHQGIIDYGYSNPNSRHTVHYNKSERDSRTNYLLKTIPEGENASVRLGNWLVGAQAESITYRYKVDTNNFDLLMMKYAIVLEDAEHNFNNQPRFTLEILNSSGNLLDTICSSANFYASDSLGWNRVGTTAVIWKDWTNIGFDISAYHNQVISIRLTTYDCNHGGHYGYAYYTLKCDKKRLTGSTCGDTNMINYKAPQGFNYRWYNSNDTSQTLSTDIELEINLDTNITYYCHVSFLDNPNCGFTIEVESMKRYPKADFDYTYTIKDCEFEVSFINLSKILYNDSILVNTPCDDAKWIFDDGVIIDQYSPKRRFSVAGEYSVKLIAILGDGKCQDTIVKKILLIKDSNYLKIIGDSSLCENQSTILTSSLDGEYLWSTNESTKSINLSPISNQTITLYLKDSSGCINKAIKEIQVHPIYDSIIVIDTICDNTTYSVQGYDISSPGKYILNLKSIYNCDSIVYLDLSFKEHYRGEDTIYAFSCDNQFYTEHGLNTDSTGVYEIILIKENGCDSIFIVNLIVFPTFSDTIYAEIYKGGVYNQNGFNETQTGVYTQTFQNYLGCDSLKVLNLQVDNILFPNVVTPNGDGINDVFSIHNLIKQEAFPENELIIFTRQGKQIYRIQKIKEEKDNWDPNKTNTPDGTYFFRFIGKRNDKKIDTVGVIEVLR